MKGLYTIINFYTQRFNFPHRGWKYVRYWLQALQLDHRIYRKRIQKNIYLHVNTVDHVQQQLFWYGYYEKAAIILWQVLIKTDSTIIDIGANIGYYSVMAANISKNGHVYSFEPSPQIYGQLLLNIEANHLLNVKTFRCAVGRREGNLPFYLSGPDNTGMSGLRAAENYSGQTVITEVIVLDRWAADNKMKKIDFIKMDIEGAELEALSGMTIILEQQQPVLFIEIRLPLLQQFDQTPDAIYQLLYGFGYSAFEIGEKLTVRKINSFPEGDSILFIPKHFHFPDEITIVE